MKPLGSQVEKMGQSDTQVVEMRPLALRQKEREIVNIQGEEMLAP